LYSKRGQSGLTIKIIHEAKNHEGKEKTFVVLRFADDFPRERTG